VASPKTVTCTQYTLAVDHTPGKFQFLLAATGGDGTVYYLQATDGNDQPGLVVDAFHALGKVWPSFAFRFEASGKRITKFL
jgi:hypothetical protein